MPTSSDTVQQLVRQLYGLGLVQREINRHALAELGSQGFAALAIVGLHGPLRVSDVAARLHVDLSVAAGRSPPSTAPGTSRARPTAGTGAPSSSP